MTNVNEVLKERGNRYGDFATHANITMALKLCIHQHIKDYAKEDVITADMVEALDMICHKIGRIVNGDPTYADSWVDIAGYAKLVSDRLEADAKELVTKKKK